MIAPVFVLVNRFEENRAKMSTTYLHIQHGSGMLRFCQMCGTVIANHQKLCYTGYNHFERSKCYDILSDPLEAC